MTIAARYSKNRAWALALAGSTSLYGATDEGRLAALVVLWVCCREYEGGDFRAYARPRIEAALANELPTEGVTT